MIQEVYRSGVIRLQGDIKGKQHVVNGQCLKHYIAGQNFVRRVEKVNLGTAEKAIEHKYSCQKFQNQ